MGYAMNKHDRQYLLSQIKGDFLEILATLAFIATAFTLAYGVKLVVEVTHGKETIEKIDEKREKRCKYYDECISRLSSSTLEAQHYHCVKEAEEKVKNK